MLAHKFAVGVAVVLLSAMSLFRIAMPKAFTIDEKIDPLFQQFPKQIGDWLGEDHEVDKRTYEILETKNVLSRMYKHPDGAELHLLLVSSDKDRRVAHPPEVCYLGSNYFITNQHEKMLKIGESKIPVKEFSAKSERYANQEQKVLYLYKVGDEYTTSYYSQQLKFAIDQISKSSSKIILIRLSSESSDTYPEFLQLLLPLLG